MKFLDRTDERERLTRLLDGRAGGTDGGVAGRRGS